MPPFSAQIFRSRLDRLRAAFAAHHLDGFLITHLPDVYYLTAFTGSNAALFVTASAATLFTDSRYTQQAREQVRGARVVIGKRSALVAAAQALPATYSGRFGADANSLTVADFRLLAKTIKAAAPRARMSAQASPVAALRVIKDAAELERMRRAARLGCELFASLRAHIVPGARESDVAAHLEHAARTAGAERMSFDTIVAGGARGALPHGVASAAKLPRTGLVVLDFGVVLDGYCSDMTRTVALGRPPGEQRAAYAAVLEAQMAAVDAIRPGVTCGEVDLAARTVLKKAKLAKYFSHSTGHGVGIEIHESPRIAAAEKTVLKPGMVITVEPGVYLPGKFGIRIEDMVAVTETGHEVLTPAPKEWQA